MNREEDLRMDYLMDTMERLTYEFKIAQAEFTNSFAQFAKYEDENGSVVDITQDNPYLSQAQIEQGIDQTRKYFETISEIQENANDISRTVLSLAKEEIPDYYNKSMAVKAGYNAVRSGANQCLRDLNAILDSRDPNFSDESDQVEQVGFYRRSVNIRLSDVIASKSDSDSGSEFDSDVESVAKRYRIATEGGEEKARDGPGKHTYQQILASLDKNSKAFVERGGNVQSISPNHATAQATQQQLAPSVNPSLTSLPHVSSEVKTSVITPVAAEESVAITTQPLLSRSFGFIKNLVSNAFTSDDSEVSSRSLGESVTHNPINTQPKLRVIDQAIHKDSATVTTNLSAGDNMSSAKEESSPELRASSSGPKFM